MANITNIEIKNNSITATVGSTGDLSCNEQVSVSSNGKYYFGYGIYYATLNSDGIESLFLFTSDSMVYRKKFADSTLEASFVQDDGTAYFYTDDNYFISLNPEGKQNFKKHIGIYYDHKFCKIGPDLAYFFGDDDDGNTSLVFYLYSEKKLIKRIIPDAEPEDIEGNVLSAGEPFFFSSLRGILIIYTDNKNHFMFDYQGNPLTPMEGELNDARSALKEKILAEEARKRYERAKHEAWLKERQELTSLLIERFGKRKRAAIKYVAKSKNISLSKAETIVESIYADVTPEQIECARKARLERDQAEIQQKLEQAKAERKKATEDAKLQISNTKSELKESLENARNDRISFKHKLASFFNRKNDKY